MRREMKGKIEFEGDGVEIPPFRINALRNWIREVSYGYGYEVRRLGYLFVNDEEMLKWNRLHLGHDYYTDIITFDYTRPGELCGEMIISVDTVRSNAEMLRVDYAVEMLRVIIHGVLHLCGINDKGSGEREKMETAENAALEIWDEKYADQ